MISIEYLAGFFDGEGSIGVYKRKDAHKPKFSVVVVNTNKQAITLFREFFQVGKIYPHRKNETHYKDSWRWIVAGRHEVEGVLKKLVGHLSVKQRDAEIALNIIRMIKAGNRCGVPECKRPHLARHLCSMHYQRFRARKAG